MSGPSNEPPIVTVVGERVALGPLRRDLLPLYQRWINDLSAVRNFGVPPRPQTAEQEAAWYDAAATAADTTSFTVYERATWRPVGTTALRDIDFRHRRAEFGILIGADDRGEGYGTEATRLTLDYASPRSACTTSCCASTSTTWPASAPTPGPASASSAAVGRRSGWAGISGTRFIWSVSPPSSGARSLAASSCRTNRRGECGKRQAASVMREANCVFRNDVLRIAYCVLRTP